MHTSLYFVCISKLRRRAIGATEKASKLSMNMSQTGIQFFFPKVASDHTKQLSSRHAVPHHSGGSFVGPYKQTEGHGIQWTRQYLPSIDSLPTKQWNLCKHHPTSK